MSYVNERRCIELLLVPMMFSDVMLHGLEGEGASPSQTNHLSAHLTASITCTLLEIPERNRTKVLRRAERTFHEVFVPFRNLKRVGVTGLAAFYWFQDLVLSGYFVLPEDHPLQQALDRLLPELKPTADVPGLEAEARLEAGRLMQVLQRATLFKGAPTAAAA